MSKQPTDVKMFDFSDLLGLGRVGEKLLEMIQAGCGALYKPLGIVREAKAQAKANLILANTRNKEIEALASVVRDNSDIPISSNGTQIAIDPSITPLAERAKARLIYNAVTDQANIESIISFTVEELKHATMISEDTVDKKWARRFFGNATEISDEETQKLWAQVLAGEIKKKGSFSLRTLDVLKNLSQEEAKLFKKISKFVINNFSFGYILSDLNALKTFSIEFMDLMTLENCGILSTAKKSIKITDKSFQIDIFCFLCEENGKERDKRSLSFKAEFLELSAFPLTDSGVELLSLIETSLNEEYLIKVIVNTNESGYYPKITKMYRFIDRFKEINEYKDEQNLLEL